MARGSKKIVFVIVEGPSDDEALGVILSRLYDKNSVHVEITYGDITSDFSVTNTNIVSKIGDLVRRYAGSNHYAAADFQGVVHLIDMDGAYISDTDIIEDACAEKPYYTAAKIYTANPESIRGRNDRKRGNINRICPLRKVWGGIPYRAYYMSSNLDHVLYNKQNNGNRDKEDDAYRFAKQYKNDLDGFLAFMSDSAFAVCGDFRNSWEFIKQSSHSLERHSNFGICFEKIRKMRNAEMKRRTGGGT